MVSESEYSLIEPEVISADDIVYTFCRVFESSTVSFVKRLSNFKSEVFLLTSWVAHQSSSIESIYPLQCVIHCRDSSSYRIPLWSAKPKDSHSCGVNFSISSRSSSEIPAQYSSLVITPR